MRGVSDQQQSTIIGIVARVPVQEARRLFLERFEAQLPARGKVSDAQLLAAVDKTLKSFTPGQWHGDAQGLIPMIDASMSLQEASDLWERTIHPRGEWHWPPIPPLTPEQQAECNRPLNMSLDEAAMRYAESLGPDAVERLKAERAKPKSAPVVFDPSLPAPSKPPLPPIEADIQIEPQAITEHDIEPAPVEPAAPDAFDKDLVGTARDPRFFNAADWEDDPNTSQSALEWSRRPAGRRNRRRRLSDRIGIGGIKAFFK